MKNVTVGLGGPTVINKPGTGIVNTGGEAGKRQVNGATFMILPPKAVIAKAEEGIKTPINNKTPRNIRGDLILL